MIDTVEVVGISMGLEDIENLSMDRAKPRLGNRVGRKWAARPAPCLRWQIQSLQHPDHWVGHLTTRNGLERTVKEPEGISKVS